MHKMLLLVAALAATALSAGNAMAFENVAVGDAISGVNTGVINFGDAIRCNDSTLAGTVTVDNGADAGGTANITSATFTNCTDDFSGPATVTATSLPWVLTVDKDGMGTLSGINLDMVLRSTSTCRYTGALDLTYDAADFGGTGDATFWGPLTRASGTYPCGSAMTFNETYNITGPNGIIDL